MPCDYREYPKNWKWLSEQVRKRNGGRCELCFAPNGKIVYRPKAEEIFDYPWLKDNFLLHTATRPTKIILTVHHIDCDKANNSEQNLISLCQRCHLRLDIAKHMANRKRKNAPLFEKENARGE